MELIKQAVGNLRGVGVLANPDTNRAENAVTKEVARSLGLAVHDFVFRSPADLEQMASSNARAEIGAIYLISDPLVFTNRIAIAQFAVKQKLPMISRLKEYASDGALMSYGPSFPVFFRGAADYVDKIWKGAKPGDLPIEQPREYELVINMQTAKALGLAIPQALLVRANELIQS